VGGMPTSSILKIHACRKLSPIFSKIDLTLTTDELYTLLLSFPPVYCK
jgi:hypothetical protein